jgi:putative transposase
MRKSRFSEEQIIEILRAAEIGQKVQDLVRKHGISEHTFYRWRAKYGGNDGAALRDVAHPNEEWRARRRYAASGVAFKRKTQIDGKTGGAMRCRGDGPGAPAHGVFSNSL